MKRYKGQALAVIMIVLVVASILGLSMYSRTIRDTRRIAFEKSSAESFEVSESVIESLKGVTVSQIETVCAQSRFGNQNLRSTNGCRVIGYSDVNEFLSRLGVFVNIDNIGKCSDDSSSVEIVARIATDQDEIEIGQGQARAFIFKTQTPTTPICNLNLAFDPKGLNTLGVGLMRKYATSDPGVLKTYKSYHQSDNFQYCIYKSGSSCASDPNLIGTWTPLLSGQNAIISLNPSLPYKMEEIRITSFNGTVGVKASVSPAQCVRDWEMVKIVVNANCSGASRGVEIQFPQNEWSLPIFDYVIYNGQGALGDN